MNDQPSSNYKPAIMARSASYDLVFDAFLSIDEADLTNFSAKIGAALTIEVLPPGALSLRIKASA